MHSSRMIESNPAPVPMAVEGLSACIDACFDCAQACIACADACLGEKQIDILRRCIRLDQDCRDICLATGGVLSRQQQPEMALVRSQLETCAMACRLCATECEKHAGMHEHCRICAEACRACEQACNQALSIAKTGGSTARA